MPNAPYDHDDDDWLDDDIHWRDHDDESSMPSRGSAVHAEHAGRDDDLDHYPTLDVTGHHYVVVHHFDRPFVIVNHNYDNSTTVAHDHNLVAPLDHDHDNNATTIRVRRSGDGLHP
jgi:hypothetical protein